MAEIILDNVVKAYGDVLAVNNVSLTVADGEFVALVGPSGCGKTTTLNMIAGLIELTDGTIKLGERVINDLDPKDRDIAMVFQNYALYPNKSVYDNLAFPLQMRKTPKDEIKQRVEQTAEVLSITPLLQRRPKELSGGQQQRVALGRALVRQPQAFLMDEPLSNLDAKLRVQMRAELKRFHQELHATVVYVTHDQLEAMTMADRIAVMSGGVLQQYGSPDELFNHPVNLFVAGFIGSPAMTFLRGRVQPRDGATYLAGDTWQYKLDPRSAARAQASTGEVVMGVRHSAVEVFTSEQPDALPARIYTVEPTGDVTFVHLMVGDAILVASMDGSFRGQPDQPVWVQFDPERLHLFDAATELTLEGATRSGSRQGVAAPAAD